MLLKMSECNDEDRNDKDKLPAYQRTQKISEIFTNVQSILPDMEFSDHENDENSNAVSTNN